MDAKITKKRLGTMLSYDWGKMLLAILSFILVWAIVFSSSATKITPPQTFTIYYYPGVEGGEDYYGLGAIAKREGVFSYDVLETHSTNMGKKEEGARDLLLAQLPSQEGDVLFAVDSTYKSKKEYEVDGVKYTPTYLEQFLIRFENYAREVDGENGLLTEMKAYLLRYYDETLQVMDEGKVEKDFKARVKKLNDKRFNSQKEFKKGLPREIERIALLKKNYEEFLGYLNEGIITLEHCLFHRQNYDESYITYEGNYAINLNKDGKNQNNRLMNVAYGYKEGEEGEKTRTTENLCVVLLDPAKSKYSYGKFESISFVNFIVRQYILPYLN